LSLVCRGRPGLVRSHPLFSARTAIESTTALDQSTSLTTFNRVTNAWCSRSYSPAVVHSVKRRCTVVRLVPNIPVGSFRHEQPAWTMQTIGASTALSLTRAVPPPCGRGGGTRNNGCATCQKSSGANVRIMSSVTNTEATAPPRETRLNRLLQAGKASERSSRATVLNPRLHGGPKQ